METIQFHNELDAKTVEQIQEHRPWFLALGICLVALGMLATIFAYTSTIFSVIYLGIFFMILGVFEIVQSFWLSRWTTFFLHLFLGVLYSIGGFFIFMHPAENAISLTLLLAIFFVVAGTLKVIFSIAKNLPHKWWLAASGVLSIILGILIWQQWPLSGLWVIGMLLGIDTIFSGWTLIMLSFYAKNLKPSTLSSGR